MESLFNIILVSLLYLFLNTNIYNEYFLKRVDGAIDMNNTITNKGEIIKFIAFVIMYIIISLL